MMKHFIQAFLSAPLLEVPGVDTFELPTADLLESDVVLTKGSTVFGKRMERVLSAAISRAGFEIIAENLVIQGEQTLGEFDFILRHGEEVYHVECVFKFYLEDRRLEAPWIGPNRKDSFEEKREKLLTKQFPLLFGAGRSAVADLGVDVDRVKQAVHFKALRFVHESDYTSEFSGWWMYKVAFDQEVQKDALYLLPRKYAWANDPSTGDEWISYTAAITAINEQHELERNPMVWRKMNDEYARFFVVCWSSEP